MKYITAICYVILPILARRGLAEEPRTKSIQPTTTQETKINEHTRRLLLDPRIVDKTRNAKLTIGEVKKHSANPLFGEDKT